MIIGASTSSSLHHPSVDFYNENYFACRKKFLDCAKANENVAFIESISIAAKGPNLESLYIDLAWLGSQDATEILIHISGTHGVEGFPGSAIQSSWLTCGSRLKSHQAILFVHGLNPFGMAYYRRTNENNVDLNRNLTDQRNSPPLYEKINALINPPEKFNKDTFFDELAGLESQYGGPEIKAALIGGQYQFPEGLFYGGNQIEEGPQKLLEWIENNFKGKGKKFGIVDVHSGLGIYGEDILITPEPPTEKMIDYFGTRISGPTQKKTVGYNALGVFSAALGETIKKVSAISEENIFILGQEFGTLSIKDVIKALVEENNVYHLAKKQGKGLDLSGYESQALFRAFYPLDIQWRQSVMKLGRTLIADAFVLLEK